MIASILIVLNLIILEILLSIDNVAVLSLLVKDLGKDAPKALKWGMWGAYIMRGACLLCASWLVGLWWLKLAGGLYLCYLTWGHFTKAVDTAEEDIAQGKDKSRLWHFLQKHTHMSNLWMTIVLVEFMDMTFSVDNIFAAVAMTPNKWLIIAGVFIGIAAIRVIAAWFIELIKKYPTLEPAAYLVIGLLGLKLIVGAISVEKVFNWTRVNSVMSEHWFDLTFSAIMLGIFIMSALFGGGDGNDPHEKAMDGVVS